MKNDINYIHLESVNSTNSYLFDHRSSMEHKITVVTADYQIAGKGQGGNTWESEQGKNLLFSILIHPESILANCQFLISMAISLAVKDALNEYIVDDVRVKWPNDVYYKDKKICGILIENNLSGNSIKDCIIGIGVDVNQRLFLSNAPNPISMYNILGYETDLGELLRRIVSRFDYFMQDIEKGECAIIKAQYLSVLYRRNGTHPYVDQNGAFMADLVTVQDDGHLVLKDSESRTRKYAFKEVKFIINK
jgi:BirA family transcriptional regulator, biotin operon repressor / biotin---[acetyl-CoA-carboxylase] ligase